MVLISSSMAECVIVSTPPACPTKPQTWSASFLTPRLDLSNGLTSAPKFHTDLQECGAQQDVKPISLSDADPVHACHSRVEAIAFPLLQQLTDRSVASCWTHPESGGQKALFLDYDGTLREFEARPEQAVPTTEIMELLTAINKRNDLAAHIISGRDAAFLEANFGKLDRFTLIAEHGYQILKPGSGQWALFQDASYHDGPSWTWKSVVHPVMSTFVTAVPDTHVEEKATALVWHYREAREDQANAAAASLMTILEEVRQRERLANIRISHGHKIVEVSYKKVNKGLVLREICHERSQAGRPFEAVLAIGDDKTDEFMFSAAPQDSLTVKVGPGETQAKFRIENPAAVRGLLQKL